MKLYAAALIAASLLAPAFPAPSVYAAVPAPADVPSGTYKIDLTHASVVWKVKHMGLAMYASRFTKFDAVIKYDAATPIKSSVVVTIDPKSVRTDYPFPEKENFDAKLATDAKIFNANAFPEIKFVSTRLIRMGAVSGKLKGDLTMLGVTKPVTLDVVLSGTMKEHPFSKKPALGFSATGTIKRSDFGMTFGTPMVGDDVQLDINAEFQKAD